VPGFKATIPFHEGIRKTLAWYDEDEARKQVDPSAHENVDAIIRAYEAAMG
jgi:hypothetical protein